MEKFKLKQITPFLYEMIKSREMLVPARIYGDKVIIDQLIEDINQEKDWNALRQLHNVACLPGIINYALAMSDIHPGYGFPIGGVAAFDLETGVISVAGVGFDINCGVRSLLLSLTKDDLEKSEIKESLAEALFREIPAGLGSEGEIKLTLTEIDRVMIDGAKFVLDRGLGIPEDLDFVEENGCIANALVDKVSVKAKQRQVNQVGTLGSGNHYLEVQYVSEIFNQEVARVYDLKLKQIIISIHCGSRALGHQIGTDYLKILEAASRKYNIPIRERELVCAPFNSPEGRDYFAAVNCGINSAFANRQALTHLVRQTLKRIFGIAHEQVKVFYDIGHNTVKVESHLVAGQEKKLLVHRKGSTRAFGPGRMEVPVKYRSVGQPVIIGGTMGTHSYILVGTDAAMQQTWGSACHGAGRQMSRIQAKKKWRADDLVRELAKQGIIIKGHSKAGLAEEAPGSYKDVDRVVGVMHQAGIALKVAKLKPIIVIKG